MTYIAYRPKAKTAGILAERSGDELVVYDVERQVAHCLSAEAALVWERCDGQLSEPELARELAREPAVVAQALVELRDRGLLDDQSISKSAYSRRELTARLGKVGGVVLVTPLIYSVAVPPAPAAASSTCTPTGGTVSCGGSGVHANSTCCSGVCQHSGASQVCIACTTTGGTCSTSTPFTCCSGVCNAGVCT